MTKEQQLKIYEEIDSELLEITKSKGHDYASTDVLSNFKEISGAAKLLRVDATTPTGYAMFMVLLKIGRLGNLLSSGKTPNNESVEDSFKDGINYFKLAYCNHLEK